MRILIINPNTNAEMTKGVAASAEKSRDPRTQVDVVTNPAGPLSIEGFFDEVLSAPSVLELMVREEATYDAFIIACYSPHPAILAGREALAKPVIGILEASLHLASLVADRFAVVTTSPRWEPLLTEGVRQVGLESRCAGVFSSGLAVLDLDAKPPEEVAQILFEVSGRAVRERGAEAICLGCAGMAGLDVRLQRELGVPVIDPIGAAVKLAEALGYLGLATSKTGAYRPVEPRETMGLPEAFGRVYRPAP